MPEGAVCVTRPGRWGNQFAPGVSFIVRDECSGETLGKYVCQTRAEAVDLFRNYVDSDAGFDIREAARNELRGKDLACFCPLDQPCHADVLLEIANQ